MATGKQDVKEKTMNNFVPPKEENFLTS